MIKVLSLFDGISGARQALKELNIDCAYYASEIDKFAIQVSKNNYPDIVQIGNVKGIIIEDDYIFYNQDNDPMQNGGSFKSDVDLLIGGSPCQDLSIAKKNRQGLRGERSGLFWEYVRILNETKPKFFILENVASMESIAKDHITDTLFGIKPIEINSALTSAQQRRRVYWIGRRVGDTYEQVHIEQPQDREIYIRDILEPEVDPKYFVSETGLQYLERIKFKGVRSVDDKALTLTASSHKGVGNDGCTLVKVPIRVGHFGKGGQGDRVYSSDGKSVCLSANGGGRGAKTGLYEIKGCAIRGRYKDDSKETQQTLEIREDEKTNCLTSVSKDSLVQIKDMVRKLTPTECARLQGYPDFYHNGISNSQAYKCYGNSFTVPVIKHILQHLFLEV
jgi:DNA (cytosine-5)-methyltransferase 3A